MDGPEPTIPDLIRTAASRFGDADYLVTPDERLSFAAADQRSQVEAERLLRSGVGKGTRVGMLFPQGVDFVVAFLAITRIGAVAVPLSTFLAPPELRRAARHADLDTLLVPAELFGRATTELLTTTWPDLDLTLALEEGAPRLLLGDAPYLRQVHEWGGHGPGRAGSAPLPTGFLDEVEREVRPSDLLVMIHTSGATAEPKAVLHTHGAQLRQAGRLAELYELDADTRTFTTMPFFWVGGLTVTLLSHLHVGAAVLTIERMDPPAMVDLIEGAGATRVVGWTLTDRILGDPALADRDLSWMDALQLPGMRHPGKRHNSLGMSETGGPHSAAPAADLVDDLPPEHLGSFGPPVSGMQHRIVDPDTGLELEAGADGEIWVRGPSLMEGLYKRERHDTFDADGWYRTGDRGFLRDGLLFFTGRHTEMIKTSGANVAPREVELAVEALPGVQAAFVVGLPDADRGELVGCLVCPVPGHHLDLDDLTARLRGQLSSYKVPRRIMVVPYEDAPWLASGKISKPRIRELLMG